MQIPDNLDHFERYDAEQERQLQKLPVCCYCGETVQDDFLYLINDEIICIGCLNDHFRKDVDEYVS